MSQQRKIQFSQWLTIVVAWQFVGFVIACYDHFLVTSGDYVYITEGYSFLRNLIFDLGGAFAGALLGGSFFVFYVNVKYRDKPYAYSILAVCIGYLVIISSITLVIGLFYVPETTGVVMSNPAFKQKYWEFLANSYHLKDLLSWSIVVAMTQFFLLMSNKFGYGTLWNIILGKYHLPKEETRIFMFADLISSTTIAEKLGDKHYHDLLKDFFADVTAPIINHKGEIYQYIGDEVVIVWKYESGIADNNCIRCFFDMKKRIEMNKDYYLREYGLIPAFKAGIHFGNVIAGEIGIIKRDITFSGDVLNTASRIQNKCNEFNVEVIASDELLSNLSFADYFTAKHLGNIKLRGKEKEMGLSTVLARA